MRFLLQAFLLTTFFILGFLFAHEPFRKTVTSVFRDADIPAKVEAVKKEFSGPSSLKKEAPADPRESLVRTAPDSAPRPSKAASSSKKKPARQEARAKPQSPAPKAKPTPKAAPQEDTTAQDKKALENLLDEDVSP
ncbi:MAG: hypothetical protein AB1405_16330 [Bdellovibrionota bacterium]